MDVSGRVGRGLLLLLLVSAVGAQDAQEPSFMERMMATLFNHITQRYAISQCENRQRIKNKRLKKALRYFSTEME